MLNLVYKLLSKRKFIIVANQYYGAIHTARAIQRLEHHVLMTIQKNYPLNLIKDFLHKYLKRKENKSLAVLNDNTLCILSYYDTRKCNFISSFKTIEIIAKNTKPNIVV